MSGNEKYLVPDIEKLFTGSNRATLYAKYADPSVEGFEGAKRGGSPNLAKLANACRFLDTSFDYKKLGFKDPEQEFIDWMEYEEENGFMWNEQGPSPISVSYTHLTLPTIYSV